MTSAVQVITMTWPRDSHFLYDYSDSEISTQKLKAHGNAQLILRQRRQCLLISEEQEVDHTAEVSLGWLLEDADGFCFTSAYRDQPRWTVVRWGRKEGHQLAAGQLLKFGRVLMKVHRIHTGAGSSLHWESTEVSTSNVEKQPCRVCLCDEDSQDDPLISPCKCTGSIRFVHARCLVEMLRSRMNLKVKGVVSTYIWTRYACELCKTRFPRRVVVEESSVELLSFILPTEGSYIVLESVPDDSSLMLYVVRLAEGADVGVGRDMDNELVLRDIGVSRQHAKIRLRKGRCLLVDLRSKFGTLVLARDIERLPESEPIAFQVNNTVVRLKTETERRCCPWWRNRVHAAGKYVRKAPGDENSLSSASMYRNQHMVSLGYSPVDPSNLSLNPLMT